MSKLDASTGLTTKEIGAIKYNVKKEIARQLPELPDPVEIKLFFQGRDAWLFSWNLLNEDLPIESNDTISLEVTVKLKREFHDYRITTRQNFLCKVKMQEDIYRPKLSVTKSIK